MSPLLFGPTDGQVEQLQEQFPDATEERLDDGRSLVTIPAFPLPLGWNQAATETRLVMPLGYPVAKPDCFYAERGLRLVDGSMPRNAKEMAVPEFDGDTWLWFSWHLVTWKAGRDGYLTFVRVVEQRFAEAA